MYLFIGGGVSLWPRDPSPARARACIEAAAGLRADMRYRYDHFRTCDLRT